MPTNSEQTETPEARAEAAARDLVDTGRNVTARAVREAAGVRMAVAAEAARAWRDAVANEPEVIVPPSSGRCRGAAQRHLGRFLPCSGLCNVSRT